jgi:hypothetical protein
MVRVESSRPPGVSSSTSSAWAPSELARAMARSSSPGVTGWIVSERTSLSTSGCCADTGEQSPKTAIKPISTKRLRRSVHCAEPWLAPSRAFPDPNACTHPCDYFCRKGPGAPPGSPPARVFVFVAGWESADPTSCAPPTAICRRSSCAALLAGSSLRASSASLFASSVWPSAKSSRPNTKVRIGRGRPVSAPRAPLCGPPRHRRSAPAPRPARHAPRPLCRRRPRQTGRAARPQAAARGRGSPWPGQPASEPARAA